MADPALLAEAYRRGLLPPDKAALYEEAQRRGVVGGGPQPAKGPFGEVFGGAMNLYRQIPLMDEGAAAFGAAGLMAEGKAKSIPDAWKQARDTQDVNAEDFQRRRPLTTAAIKGTGDSALMLVPGGKAANVFAGASEAANASRLAKVARVGTNMARGATLAAGTAYAYGAADKGSLAERGAAGNSGATNPYVLGLGAAGGALARSGAPKTARTPAPTLDELTAQKTAAYKAVDDSGVTYTPQAFKSLSAKMAQAADAAGFHAGLHPKTAAMLEKIGASDRGVGGYAPTLTQLDQLRQQIGNDLAGASDAGERRMGSILRDQIDEFIANTKPEHLSGGDAETAAQALVKARNLNTRVMKLRSLDNLDEAAADRASATGSGGNINNATRQNVIRFKNKTRNLTPAEQEAAQTVISGTRVGNALRQVGKLSPQGNGLMLGGHLAGVATGFVTHGATAGIAGASAVAGAVARAASDAITARNVQALRDLIATGGEAAEETTRQLSAAKGPEADALRRTVAARLATGAGAAGGSQASQNIYARP
jgi:hypothetical protein